MANICDLKSNPKIQQRVADLSKLIGESAATAAIFGNNGYPINKTPDGKQSILYQELLDFYEDVQKASYLKSQIYASDKFTGEEPSAQELLRNHYDLNSYRIAMKSELRRLLNEAVPKNRIEILKKFNSIHKTNFGYDYNTDSITDKGFVITQGNINPDLLKKNKNKLNADSLTYILNYLKGKFPNLLFEVLAGNNYFTRFAPVFNSTNLPTSFIYNNTIYINSDVITEEVLYEEFLHPLVNLLKLLNQELFTSLLTLATKDFPELYNEVYTIYSKLGSQDEELVTQVLSRYLKQEISTKGLNKRTILNYINKVLDWISQHLSTLFGIESKDTKLTAKDFLKICTFKDLAEIINAKEVTVDASLKGWRANIPSNPIIITSPLNTAKEAEIQNGVDMLRHPDANGMHFGNPFSHNKKLTGVLLTDTVKEAVIAFEKWLRKEDYLNVQTERRDWILSKLESGELIGKPLIYYTNSVPDNSYGEIFYNPETAPNHVHILLKLIKEYAELINYKPKDLIEQKMKDFLFFATGNNSLFIRFLQGDEEALKLIQKLTAMWQLRLNELLSFRRSFGKVLYNKETGTFDFESYFKSPDNLYNEFTEETASVFNLILNFKVHEAEAILPRTYESSFKIGNHTLGEIDEKFFRKVNPFYKTLAKNTDILVRLHNDRFNISIKSQLKGNEDEVPVKVLRSEDGYRLDKQGNKMYKLPEDAAVFVNEKGNEHIVFLDKDFVESKVLSLLSSTKNLVSILPFMSNFRDFERAKNLTTKLLGFNNIKTFNTSIRNITKSVENLQDLKKQLLDLYLDPKSKSIYSKTLSSTLYNSFLQSLHFIAARIPTQDLLSFMAMKNVAFTGSKGNDVFVTRWLYWLLGSDMDIKSLIINQL